MLRGKGAAGIAMLISPKGQSADTAGGFASAALYQIGVGTVSSLDGRQIVLLTATQTTMGVAHLSWRYGFAYPGATVLPSHGLGATEASR